MDREKKMELDLKSEELKPDKRTQLEEMIEENTTQVVDILREKNYEIIEPTQKTEPEKVTTARKMPSGESKVIGFSGKGGVGKTSLAGLLLRVILEKNSQAVLAIDSDPNSCLPEILGVQDYKTLSEMVEQYKGGRLPPRKFQQEFNTLLLENEQDAYDLLPMGKSEGQGCYCSINNLLRNAFQEFVLKGNYSYDYVVVDLEAGIEHISRKTSAFLSDLVIVTDGSKMSINTIKNIYDTSEDVKIEIENIYVIANRVENEKILKKIENTTKELGITYLGNIPEDKSLKELNFKGKSIFELPEKSPAYLKIKEIASKILS